MLAHGPVEHLMRNLIFAAILSTQLLLVGCAGVGALSPVKRAPVYIAPIETHLPSSTQPILIQFESTLPGRVVVETVWDNVTGAFADTAESKQIGYTQDYSKFIPAAAAGGAIGGAVVGTRPSYTRIVIPFGRIFEGV
ncbi:MAG: hypothetical protein HXY26_10785, partial [Hydrogenophilaceae bacterium]|nr:hypothetical protein [Hydrogenophilaceae bacterium]